ncbi:MAG: hypothetical protein JO353_01690 [Phycisphaerae bacterium]|nr:hypothetical protein [Phycisphaerae bacterium]
MQTDEHLLTVLRYVERNPVRAGIVERAVDWRWSSLNTWRTPGHELSPLLSDWPLDRPRNWVAWLNEPQIETELEAERALMKLHIARGRPFGDDAWMLSTCQRLKCLSALRPPGRPTGWRKRERKRKKKDGK